MWIGAWLEFGKSYWDLGREMGGGCDTKEEKRYNDRTATSVTIEMNSESQGERGHYLFKQGTFLNVISDRLIHIK